MPEPEPNRTWEHYPELARVGTLSVRLENHVGDGDGSGDDPGNGEVGLELVLVPEIPSNRAKALVAQVGEATEPSESESDLP